MQTELTVTQTPGPWTVHPYSTVAAGTIAATDKRPGWTYRDIIIGAGETIVARVESSTIPPEMAGYPRVREDQEAEANARLIMAAPDLLAVLHEVREVLDQYSDVRDGEDGFPRPNAAMAMLTRVEAAIARVEGRR
jgi:hypothetical protein